MKSLVEKFTQISFGRLKGLLSKYPGAVPTDIDGIIERNGHFLVIETKFPDKMFGALPTGQRIALQALSRLPQFTVCVIGTHGEETEVCGVWDFKPFRWYFYVNGLKTKAEDITPEQFDEWYVNWFNSK